MRRDMAITLVVAAAIIVFGLILIITQTQNVATLEENIADVQATVTAQADAGSMQTTEMAARAATMEAEATAALAEAEATAEAQATEQASLLAEAEEAAAATQAALDEALAAAVEEAATTQANAAATADAMATESAEAAATTQADLLAEAEESAATAQAAALATADAIAAEAEEAAAATQAALDEALAAAVEEAATTQANAAATADAMATESAEAAATTQAALDEALAAAVEEAATTQAIAAATATFAEIRIGTLEPVFPTMEARAQATQSALQDALAAAESTQAALADALATSEARPTTAAAQATPTLTPIKPPPDADAGETDATPLPAPDTIDDSTPVADVAVRNLSYVETFDAVGDWFTGETERGNIQVTDGAYVFTVTLPPSNLRVFNLPFVANNYIEATFTIDECPPLAYAGLIFRTSDATDGYVFLVSCTLDLWAIIELTGDDSEVLVAEEIAPSDTSGPQTFGVLGEGETLRLYLNGALLGETTSASYERGIVGFYLESNENPATVRWDDLRIWSLP